MQLEHLSIDGRRKLPFCGFHALAGALAPVGLAGHAGAGLAGGDGNAACDGTHG